MADPTELDKRLLQTIVLLTERNAGRPPTLAEVTEALGFQSSSRANIQRQLTRLRPTYVDWSTSPRSLQLTEAGITLLGMPLEKAAVHLPVPEDVLPLLASGLTQIVDEVNQEKPWQVPYPFVWQRALNRLAAECLQRDIDPPTHTAVVFDLCHRQLDEWPIRFPVPASVLALSLLDDDQPSELCRELAYTGDAELQIYQDKMKAVLRDAKANRSDQAYVVLRQYLIKGCTRSLQARAQATRR
jgi:hypothetical protein